MSDMKVSYETKIVNQNSTERQCNRCKKRFISNSNRESAGVDVYKRSVYSTNTAKHIKMDDQLYTTRMMMMVDEQG